MISLSNLIKSFEYVPIDTHKQVKSFYEYEDKSYKGPHYNPVETNPQEELKPKLDEETIRIKQEILGNAKDFAERQVREAGDEAERMLQEAREQIATWWEERRLQDDHLIDAIRSEAYQQGYEEGSDKAKEELQMYMNQKMEEAQVVLNDVFEAKEQIIQEAEPFLVELSSAIAEKVIDHELSADPELMIELIRKNLARKKEQGVITLCVSPKDFSFVQAAREELSFAIDSQAELKILPDATVKDKGCVIRSAFGSVDARIDTQLSEIKKELVRVALDGEELAKYEGA